MVSRTSGASWPDGGEGTRAEGFGDDVPTALPPEAAAAGVLPGAASPAEASRLASRAGEAAGVIAGSRYASAVATATASSSTSVSRTASTSRSTRSPCTRASTGGAPRRLTWYPSTDQNERMGPDNLVLGWTPDGKILFRGRSAQNFRDPGFLGIVNPENDAVYLPLKKGRNELILAVSELGGGWVFICRLTEPMN